MTDFARAQLITRFHCAECGGPLTFCYDPKWRPADNWESGDPTGAAVKYTQEFVHPCRSCIEKHTGPAKRLAAVLADLREADQ